MSHDTYDGTAGNPITQNHYLYGNGNPIRFVDPSGYMALMGELYARKIGSNLQAISSKSVQIAMGLISNMSRAVSSNLAKSVARNLSRENTGGYIGVSQMYYILTIAKLHSRFVAAGIKDGGFPKIPIQVYGSNKFPKHQDHIFDAMVGKGSNGRPIPSLLNRGSKSVSTDRSFLGSVCGGYPRPLANDGSKQACDEYPYNSSIQGGNSNYHLSNVSIRLVPARESNQQGGFISKFYNKNGLSSGSGLPFLVAPFGGDSGYFDNKWRWNKYE